MFRRALVSTSNKEGLLEFLQPISEGGCEIVSTGGTAKFLKENGIKVREVSEVTGFPEIMDGRVRTLHPKIHMGLLARDYVKEDMNLLRQHDVEPFDLVVVNLYPFEEAFSKGLKGRDLIEEIDIGGPSLLRASAKNFERITVVCDPDDYQNILEKSQKHELDNDFRQSLAAKVFEHCSYYDSVVAMSLNKKPFFQTEVSTVTLGLRQKSVLRYGENPHQSAALFESHLKNPLSLIQSQQHQGKELSYNNILDLEAAVGTLSEFEETCCVIVKHLTPCGVAVDSHIDSAYRRAFEADSVSAFGGIVALNRKLSVSLARELVGPFLECVIAPDVEPEALKILSTKKNLRILTLKNLDQPRKATSDPEIELKSIRGGVLIQTTDGPIQWNSSWKVFGENPSKEIRDDLVFAQRVVKHVKSNAIVVALNGQTLGICGGQTNRIDSVKWALERSKKNSRFAEKPVLGSDAFFPFRDSIDLAALGGISWIIQPGGSLRDSEVELAAREQGLGMVVTGVRHFKH